MALTLHLTAHDPVIGDLAVVDDGDVVIGERPIGVGRADIDIRLRGHACVADPVCALEAAQTVLFGDDIGVSQILDQLQRVAHGEDLGALDILDIARHCFGIA